MQNETIQLTESLIERFIFFLHNFLYVTSTTTVSILLKRISTPKKFAAGGSAQFAMILWFALPGEARVTVRYIVSTRVTALTPAGRGHLHCVTGAASCGEGKGDWSHNQATAKLDFVVFSAFDLIANFFTGSTLV